MVKTVRVADYIVQFLASKNIKHVFMVTGGGAMHLNDAFGRCKEMTYIACHHEQACTMAAESYFRMSGRVAAVNVTTGPGGTNALTGVYGAYVDSCAMFVVSGQVKTETLAAMSRLPLRQLGDQEVDITEMARPVTKYSQLINDPESIKYHLEKAWYLCTTGRPGPVWLDVPINIQSATIDPSSLQSFDPISEEQIWETKDLTSACKQVLSDIQNASRPVILAGSGVRLADSYQKFLEFVESVGVPVTTAFNAHDLIWNDHKLYAGRPGTVGDRPGNFAVQNSDYLLVLGCRLNIRQISYNFKSFARAARIAMVDIDAAELKKPTLKIDHPIHADLRDFFTTCAQIHSGTPKMPETKAQSNYLNQCKKWLEKYPVVLPEYRQNLHKTNPYVFVEQLFKQLPSDAIVVTANATACVATFQAANLKKGQRLYSNSGCATMGFDLPAAIGASMAANKAPVICVAGDGSIQMNIQELQTIFTHKLPIKIFLLNNLGYQSIKLTQQNFFSDNIVGCGEDSGVGFPDFELIARAYGLKYLSAKNQEETAHVIQVAIKESGPLICEIAIDEAQAFAPKLSSRRLPDGRMVSSPLEDMAPFLPREELKANLFIPAMETN